MWASVPTNRKWLIAAAVGVLAVGMYAYAKWSSGPSLQTLTVHPAAFMQQVSVSGKVVAVQNVDLGFTQGGRVARVYAQVGDVAPAGTILAEIENGDLLATLLQKQAIVEAEQAKLASLQTGTRPEEIAVAQAEVDSDTQALAQANSALLDAVRSVYTKSDNAVRNNVYQFVNAPRSANPQLNFYDSDTALSSRLLGEIPDVETLLNGWSQSVGSADAGSALPLASSVRLTSGTVTTLLSDASAVLVRAIPTASVTQANINTYASDVATGRAALDTTITALTTAMTAQKSAASALATAQKNLALKQAGTLPSDIDAQKAQVAAAQADVENVRAQIARTRILAPFTGIVTRMDAKVGMIIPSNTTEASMISDNVFQIESYVPELSVALVKTGDTASITLDAYGSGVLFGAKVVSIDPAETVKNGVSTYRTILEFSAKDSRIRSGMTANVIVTTNEREGVISIPQGLVTVRDGKKHVTVLAGGAQGEREVTTGEVSSSGDVEITSGLLDGDTVVVPGS